MTKALAESGATRRGGPRTGVALELVKYVTSFLSETITANSPPLTLLAISSCTTPEVAVVSDEAGDDLVFFLQGCAPNRLKCCPYQVSPEGALLLVPCGVSQLVIR